MIAVASSLHWSFHVVRAVTLHIYIYIYMYIVNRYMMISDKCMPALITPLHHSRS